MAFKIILVSLISLLSVYAITPVQELNMDNYLGKWYQVASSLVPMWTFSKNAFCISAEYLKRDDGNISVNNSMNSGSPSGKQGGKVGYAYTPNSNQPGKLKVNWGGKQSKSDGNYWIIKLGPVVDDKYDWAVVSEPNKLFMWVLVRDPVKYTEQYETEVKTLVDNLGFTKFWNRYKKTDRTGC